MIRSFVTVRFLLNRFKTSALLFHCRVLHVLVCFSAFLHAKKTSLFQKLKRSLFGLLGWVHNFHPICSDFCTQSVFHIFAVSTPRILTFLKIFQAVFSRFSTRAETGAFFEIYGSLNRRRWQPMPSGLNRLRLSGSSVRFCFLPYPDIKKAAGFFSFV